jgi:hypothetical protein
VAAVVIVAAIRRRGCPSLSSLSSPQSATTVGRRRHCPLPVVVAIVAIAAVVVATIDIAAMVVAAVVVASVVVTPAVLTTIVISAVVAAMVVTTIVVTVVHWGYRRRSLLS